MGNAAGKAKLRYRNGSAPPMGQLRPALSQLDCMSTTVPLNVSPPYLGGRHVPTRRSLQRSRLINLNLAGRRRPRMRYYRLLLVLVVVQLFVGIALSAVAIYTATVSPSLRIRDLPHWAGVPLIISGLMGIIFVTRWYGDFNDTRVSHVSKALSVTVVVVSIILCICAVAFLSIHMVMFTSFDECKDGPYPAAAPPGGYGGLESQDSSSTLASANNEASGTESTVVSCTCSKADVGSGLRRLFIYELIACSDVLALIKFLFIVMSIMACVGALDGCIYVCLLWCFRYKDIYIGVRTPAEGVQPSLTPSPT